MRRMTTRKRTFESTHKWLTFRLDLSRAAPKLWLLLGEAQSKCLHIAGVPLEPLVAERLHQVALVRGVRATNAIEGNTLTEDEVRRRIDGELVLPPSREYLGREVDNVLAAVNGILQQVVAERAGGDPAWRRVSPAEILGYNALVLRDLPAKEGLAPGKLRDYAVGVGSYRGAPPEDIAALVDRLCDWLNSAEFPVEPQYAIAYAILRAIMAHLYIAWIHPFGDGNGRTARLLELKILLAAGVPSPAAHLLSNHYNETRAAYYAQLDHASARGAEPPLGFIEYAVQGLVDGLHAQLAHIREQQWTVAWRDYVYEQFRDKPGEPAARRRQLVLELSKASEPVPLAAVRLVSPQVAAAYARKNQKTLARDLRELERMQLIVVEQGLVRARKESILAFLPPTAPMPERVRS